MAVVLITGVASGLGFASALAFARRGNRVHGTTRDRGRASQLEAIAHEQSLGIVIHEVDLRASDAQLALVETVLKDEGRIDILINNAATTAPGALEQIAQEKIEQVFEINFFAPLSLARAALPIMRGQESGKILMISSLSAQVGLPGDGIYSASKAALEIASESLRAEVARFGIEVSVIEFGAVDTNFLSQMEHELSHVENSPYQGLSKQIRESLRENSSGLEPEHVANELVQIASEDSLKFRYAIGNQAKAVVSKLFELPFEDRDDFIDEVSKLGWWRKGNSKK